MLYTTLKFVHVLAAATWLGGAVAASLLGAQAARMSDPVARSTTRAQLETLGQRVFGPAAGVTLVAGIATAVVGGIGMSQLWIVWGYAGVLLTGILGGGVLRRSTAALEDAASRLGVGSGEATVLARRVDRLSLLNLAVLASTVWAMVAKPTL